MILKCNRFVYTICYRPFLFAAVRAVNAVRAREQVLSGRNRERERDRD